MDIVDLGPGTLDPKTNALLVQAKGIPQGEDGDAPDYGPVAYMTGLGDFAVPWPADENGKAQGAVEQLDGGIAVLLGARDTRTAKTVGNAKPGDRIVASTGPEQAAQLQLKEAKRQAVLLTKDSAGNTVAFVLDGKNDKVQIAAFGAIFEISNDGISLATSGGAKILMQGDTIYLLGKVVVGGMTPTLPVLAGASGPAGIATPGVFVGS